MFGSLPVFLLFVWSGRRDLNPLPPPWEGGALPGELRPQACAPPVRLFVRGLVLGGGADDGSRTRDLHLGKVTLYQLSYIRMSRRPLPGRGAALVSIHLAYECRRRVVVSSTSCCCNIGHMLLWSLLAGRTVSVNPVP